MVNSITYLGHKINAEGLHSPEEKVSAITEAPAPNSVVELKAYLGLLTYYSRFLPCISTVLAPLYKLLKKNASWAWTETEDEAFQKSKDLLTLSSLLVHFDPIFFLTFTTIVRDSTKLVYPPAQSLIRQDTK